MRTVDVIGVVGFMQELGSVFLKQAGEKKELRKIGLLDESGILIPVSLWSENAIKEDYKAGQTMALKGARVSDYGGKSLNAGPEHSQMFIDPKDQPRYK